MWPVSVARSCDMFTTGRIACRREGLSPLKMHYRPGKCDGSSQRGQSMLSTIALLHLLCEVQCMTFDIVFFWGGGINSFIPSVVRHCCRFVAVMDIERIVVIDNSRRVGTNKLKLGQAALKLRM